MSYKNPNNAIPSDPPFDYDKQNSFLAKDPQLDTELDYIERALDETQDRLDLIQRADGALANESVHPTAVTEATRISLALDTEARVAAAEEARDEAQAAQIGSENARDKAEEWADNPEDVAVEAGQFSAKHHALKSGASATAAAESAALGQSTLEDFQGRYYGPLASDPATDPNGDPPTTGDLYWSTGENVLKVYDGAVWQLATTTVEGVYDVTELTNVATQDTFAFTYDVGLLQVLYNGVQLAQSDFTATNGTNVTLASAVTSATDVITFIRWGAVTESTFLGTAAVANILGTVSHASGVPTGAIIERSNGGANGDYVRFADGTQIAYRRVVLSLGTSVSAGNWTGFISWTYPASFISSDVFRSTEVKAIVVGGGTSIAVRIYSEPGDGNFKVFNTGYSLYSANVTGQSEIGSISFRQIAIGRWF